MATIQPEGTEIEMVNYYRGSNESSVVVPEEEKE